MSMTIEEAVEYFELFSDRAEQKAVIFEKTYPLLQSGFWKDKELFDIAIAALRAQQEREENPGEVSDGYHTFNELYHHRAVLFSVICNQHPERAWKSKKHHDGTMYDGMFIVGVETPEGAATYHYDIDPYWDIFHVPEVEYAPEWDGHTPAEAIRRIGTLAEAVEETI